jgi:acyl-CoA thioesterase
MAEEVKKEKKMSAWSIVEQMVKKDAFSKWLGIEVVVVEQGYAKIKCSVRDEMLNGFGITHGGICYSLADSALAFASNGRGNVAVSTNTAITHFVSVNSGDTLSAEAREVHLGDKVAHYEVAIYNQKEEKVARLNGSVYRTAKVWQPDE